MKRIITVSCVAFFSLAGFAFAQPSAAEKAEKRLAELLAPGSASPTTAVTAEPVQWKGSPVVEDISAPLRPVAAPIARLSQPPLKDAKPGAVAEARPLVSYREQTKVPKEIELPTKPLVRLPAVDVHTPVPIPILALPQKDRASLGDPSFEASLDAAMKQFTPVARQPIPFAPLNLPDPFENLRAGQLRNPPEESATPPAIPLDRPTKR